MDSKPVQKELINDIQLKIYLSITNFPKEIQVNEIIFTLKNTVKFLDKFIFKSYHYVYI